MDIPTGGQALVYGLWYKIVDGILFRRDEHEKRWVTSTNQSARTAIKYGNKDHLKTETGGKRRLTDEDVMVIKSSPKSKKELAREYGVTTQNIGWTIKHRKIKNVVA